MDDRHFTKVANKCMKKCSVPRSPLSHNRNANQSHSDVSSDSTRQLLSKRRKITSAGRMWGRGTACTQLVEM